MLNSQSVLSVFLEAHQLLTKPSVKGRALRRFLRREAQNGLVIQSFATLEGYSAAQLVELERYARGLHQEHAQFLPEGAVTFLGTVHDQAFGLVANQYRLNFDIEGASLKELRLMVDAVRELADCMRSFASYPNSTALRKAPDYQYRGYACDITDDESLWCITGNDCRGMSGVLEWCYDESDALSLLVELKRFPERFTDVRAVSWAQASVEASALAVGAA